MGGDHGPAEVVPGSIAYARANPAGHRHPGRRRGRRPLATPALLPANVRIVHAPELIGMDEHPARALVRKKRSSIVVATELVKTGEADAVVTAGPHRCGHGRGEADPGHAARHRAPGPRRPDDHRRPPVRAARHRRQPRFRPAENLAQYARMGAIFSERVLGVDAARASRCSRSARRRARATPGSSGRPSCSTRRTSTSSATSRART